MELHEELEIEFVFELTQCSQNWNFFELVFFFRYFEYEIFKSP